MFSELTVGQKLQASVIFLALGLAGYFVFANTRTVFDQTVNSWTDIRKYPVDAKARYDKERNPYDPKKEETVTVFASADGKVDFIEYPNDPDRHLRIAYLPDLRQASKTFLFYNDPMLAVKEIKDPFRHALSYAVYFKLYRPEDYNRLPAAQRSLLGQMQPAITAEQLAKEAEARKIMEASISLTNALVAAGTFHQDMVAPISKALKEFQANQKDIIKDKPKQDLGRKILTMASSYEKRVQEERGAAIEKYVIAMEGVLTDEQKDSLIAAVAKRETKATAPPGAGRRGRGTTGSRGAAPATRGATVTTRGATVTTRGATTTPSGQTRGTRAGAAPTTAPAPR